MATDPNGQKSPLDLAADLLVFAPVGLAIEAGKHLPDLARQGRKSLDGPITAAKFAKNMAVMQGRKDMGEWFRKMTEPYFGAPSAPGAPDARTGTPSGSTPTAKTTSAVGVEDLPIADYDTLSAPQVVEHLKGLGPDDLSKVEAYEQAHRARRSVLTRIDTLRQTQ